MVSDPVELLGEVLLSSGTLVVIDFGLLGMWSHSESPRLEDGDPEFVERANSAVDLQIVGPDVTEVARRLDLAAAKETFVFDMPPDGTDMVRSKVASICDSLGLEAQVVELDRMASAWSDWLRSSRLASRCRSTDRGQWPRADCRRGLRCLSTAFGCHRTRRMRVAGSPCGSMSPMALSQTRSRRVMCWSTRPD